MLKRVNVEIKAKCTNAEHIRTVLRRDNADFLGVDHQLDTYFNSNKGRMKLREGNIENRLIFYARENLTGPKKSDVILYKSNSALQLKGLLTAALGVLVVVEKVREIYYLGNVKIHIDDVRDLGFFVEIEAIDKSGNIGEEILFEQCSNYIKLFNIHEKDLINRSYSDLLMEKHGSLQ